MLATTLLTFLSVGSPTGVGFAVEHGTARVLFELGLEYAPGRAPFAQGLRPREGRALEDLQAVRMAPRQSGVLESWDGRTSLFVSHLHLDHTALVHWAHPDVPLYYPTGMEELRAACVRAGYLSWREPAGTPVPDRGVVKVGPIEVQFVAVDHDLPGATGFQVTTPDLTLAYTGDHRWHGRQPELTAAFAEAARGVDVLVQESLELVSGPVASPLATAAPAANKLSEAEVVLRFDELLAATEGLVIVNLYPMNRQRVKAMAEVSAQHGRELLLQPQAAEIAGWPRVLQDVEAVRRSPGRHCIQLGFRDLPLLIDLQPPAGSVYVQSNGPPTGEFDPAFVVLRSWLELFGLRLVHLSSSGHSRREDLVRMAVLVSPGLLLPVHTLRPDALEVPGVARLIPDPLRPYSADELRAAAAGRRRAYWSLRTPDVGQLAGPS